MASAEQVSVLIPAFNKRERSAAWWRHARRPGAVIVIDDGSSDDTSAIAAAAGAAVCIHARKGNSAAVKTGVRAARANTSSSPRRQGSIALDAGRLIAPLGGYDLVIGARSRGSTASWQRRLGNGLLNWLSSYLTDREIPDLTSGMRAGAGRSSSGSFTCCRTVSPADVTTLSFIKAGYNVHFEPISVEGARGHVEDQACARRRQVHPHRHCVMTIFSPLRVFLPVSAVSFCSARPGCGVDDRPRGGANEFVSAADRPPCCYSPSAWSRAVATCLTKKIGSGTVPLTVGV